MNCILVSAVFPPEPVVSARLSYDLHESLTSGLHCNIVLRPCPTRSVDSDACGNNSLNNNIKMIASFSSKNSKIFSRFYESWDFGYNAASWLQRNGAQGHFHVIYANVWPLFSQLHIVRAASALGIPVVMHVQDIYPESLMTKLSPFLYRSCFPVLLALDRYIVKRCTAVVLISNRISKAYAESRRLSKTVHVIRNWVDATSFFVEYSREQVCQEYNIPGSCFTFMYLGNLSALSALDTAIRSFARIADHANQFVIIGEGSLKPDCEALTRQLGLCNVLFRSEPDPNKVARLQTMADVFVLPTRKGAAISSTPSKCISYMLSGKPIVAAVDAESDVGDDLRMAGCAWLCSPEHQEDIAIAMKIAQKTTPEVRQSMGEQARRYALREFSRDVCLPRLVGIIEAAART